MNSSSGFPQSRYPTKRKSPLLTLKKAALKELEKAFKEFGTHWPMEYDAGYFNLSSAAEVERMFNRAPYYEACKPEGNVSAFFNQIADAAYKSKNHNVIDGDDAQAGITVSCALVSVGEAMGIFFKG